MRLLRKMALARSCLFVTVNLQSRFPVLGRRYPCASSIWGSVANYSKLMGKLGGGKGAKGLGPSMEKKTLPVETDPAKLTSFVCGSNIYKTGEDVKLGADSEYPDWLWTLSTARKAPTIDELDPETMEYWKLARKLYQQNINAMKARASRKNRFKKFRPK